MARAGSFHTTLSLVFAPRFSIREALTTLARGMPRVKRNRRHLSRSGTTPIADGRGALWKPCQMKCTRIARARVQTSAAEGEIF